jgi:hypothetical protein
MLRSEYPGNGSRARRAAANTVDGVRGKHCNSSRSDMLRQPANIGVRTGIQQDNLRQANLAPPKIGPIKLRLLSSPQPTDVRGMSNNTEHSEQRID